MPVSPFLWPHSHTLPTDGTIITCASLSLPVAQSYPSYSWVNQRVPLSRSFLCQSQSYPSYSIITCTSPQVSPGLWHNLTLPQCRTTRYNHNAVSVLTNRVSFSLLWRNHNLCQSALPPVTQNCVSPPLPPNFVSQSRLSAYPPFCNTTITCVILPSILFHNLSPCGTDNQNTSQQAFSPYLTCDTTITHASTGSLPSCGTKSSPRRVLSRQCRRSKKQNHAV